MKLGRNIVLFVLAGMLLGAAAGVFETTSNNYYAERFDIQAHFGEGFDLVLHDGSHEPDVVEEELKAIVPCVKKGGLILVHDTRHPKLGLESAAPRALAGTPHLTFTLPYGYGLTIIEMLDDFGWGDVELKWRKGR